MSSSMLSILSLKSDISMFVDAIASALSVIQFCASSNVQAVIVNATIEFASKLCATFESVFGFAVSSPTQYSTALSIVNVFPLLAVTFAIYLITVCPFNCCSIVII